MTSTTQTLEAHDFPPSLKNLWDIDFSDFFDLDACLQGSNSEIMELSVDELCSKFTNEETQEPATEDSQEAKTSHDLSGTQNPTIDIGGSTTEQTPGPLIQACPETAEEIAAEPIYDPIPVLEAKKIEAHIKYLRHKLQKGLLTKGQLPKEENIHEMSSYLSKLEGLGSPPSSSISETKICKVLKRIKELEEIPRDDELHIKKRAENLFNKWKLILDTQPKVIKTPQLVVIDLTEASQEVEATKAPQPEVTGLTEESEVVEAIKASQPELTDSTEGSEESEVVELTEESEVVELTEESEVVKMIKAPQPEVTVLMDGSCQPAVLLPYPNEDRRNEPNVFREGVTTRSPQSIHFCTGTCNTIPCGNSSPKQDSTSSTLKRKFSDTVSDSETTASGSGTSAKVGDKRPTSGRTKRKTPVKSYVRKESLWMKNALSGIEELLEENKRQNSRLLDFQKLMQSWGAKDEKITREWEQSG